MDVHLLYNPLSGSGRARTLAALFEAKLRRAGLKFHLHPTHRDDGSPMPPLDPATLAGSLLAVIGGDGTIHRAAPLAASAGAALYHIPSGTENLFARQFGMTTNPDDLVRALKAPRLTPMDLGTCNGHPFALMVSFGPDAGVIHRLHRTRSGPIRHWSYLRPILGELIEPNLPKLSIRVDDAPWLDRQRGMLVVANSPHYALGLNPARGALVDDGLLDAAFYPCDTITDLAAWAAKLFLDRTSLPAGAMLHRGRTFEIVPDAGGTPFQMDGEVPAAGHPGERYIPLNKYHIGIMAGAFRVLRPF